MVAAADVRLVRAIVIVLVLMKSRDLHPADLLVLGVDVFDVHVADGQRQLGTAGGILGEKLTQARGGDVGMMAGQCLPCGRGSDVRTHVQNPSAAKRTKG